MRARVLLVVGGERQRLVELGELALRLGARGAGGGGVGLVLGGGQRRLQLAALAAVTRLGRRLARAAGRGPLRFAAE